MKGAPEIPRSHEARPGALDSRHGCYWRVRVPVKLMVDVLTFCRLVTVICVAVGLV